MAKYVKTDYVPDSGVGIITSGKEYPLLGADFNGGWIECDDEMTGSIYVLFESCLFLDGRDWTVINR